MRVNPWRDQLFRRLDIYFSKLHRSIILIPSHIIQLAALVLNQKLRKSRSADHLIPLRLALAQILWVDSFQHFERAVRKVPRVEDFVASWNCGLLGGICRVLSQELCGVFEAGFEVLVLCLRRRLGVCHSANGVMTAGVGVQSVFKNCR